MKSTIRKWGNSAALRLPANAMALAGLELDSEVEIEAEDGRLVIQGVSEPEYNLEALLSDCTPAKTKITDEDRTWLDSDVAGEELW